MIASRLARNGMKGRKRDTRLLRTVITLSFLFVTVATILIFSVQATENARRYSLYGEWQLCYFGADEGEKSALMADSAVRESSVCLLVGQTEKCGLVGTLDENMSDMANFALLEGRMPQADNEIVVESSQLGAMGSGVELGSTFTLTFQQELFTLSQEEQRLKYLDVANAIIAKYDLNDLIGQCNTEFEQYYKGDYTYYASFSGQEVVPFEELSTEEYQAEFQYWFRNQKLLYNNITSNDTRGVDDMLLRLSTDLFYCGDPFEYEGRYADFQKDMYQKGTAAGQRLTIMRDYTVVGILETYSDRWDNGGYVLPNAFVTPSSGEAILKAVEIFQDSLEFAPDIAPAYNLFLSGSDAVSLRQALDPLYQGFIQADASRLGYELRPEEFSLVIIKDGQEYSYPYYADESGGGTVYTGEWGTPYRLDDFFDQALIEPLTVDEQIALSRLYHGEADAIARMYETNPPLRVNAYAYPAEAGNTERALMITVVGVIFVTSLCAVFQIFFTQMKRRARRIVLMKAIGATNGQIASMLLWESLYLLLFSLPLGALLGTGLSYGAVSVVNLMRESTPLLFTIDLPSLLFGLASGVAAVLLGIIAPLLMAMKTPLTGSIQVEGRKKRAALQKHVAPRKTKADFAAVSWRHIRLNAGRTLVEFALCAFIISILLISMMLAYLGFGDYKEQVLLANKPDFELEVSYAMAGRQLAEKLEELEGLEHIETMEAYEKGERAYLSCEALTQGKAALPAAFAQMLGESTVEDYFSRADEKDDSAPVSYVTDLYCVNAESELFARILSALEENEIDPEKFAAGEQVIVVVPLMKKGSVEPDQAADFVASDLTAIPYPKRISTLLRQAGVYASSLSRFDAALYQQDDSIAPGDPATISARNTKVGEGGASTSVLSQDVTVAGILRYCPEDGIWPFTNDVMSHSVICSFNLLDNLYPKACTRFDANGIRRLNIMSAIFYPTDYGRTFVSIYCGDGVTRENTDLPLLRYASKNYYTLRNFRESNAALYDAAVSNALITGLLGAAAGIIAMVILYNTIVSTHEQERRRFGVLQSMGVSNRRFYGLELLTGFGLGLLAVILANILVLGVLLLSSLSRGTGLGLSFGDLLRDVFARGLWLYPIKAHIALCAAFLLLTTLMQALPLKGVLRRSPIENIRG